MNRSYLIGLLSLLLSTFIYGFFGILVKTLGYELPYFYMAWVRGIGGALILLTPIVLFRTWKHIHASDWKWIFIRGVAGGVLAQTLNYYAFFYLPVGTALFTFFAGATIGGYIIGRLFFGEVITRVKIISLVLSLLGLLLVYYASISFKNPIYMGMALFGGLATAVWNTFSKKVSDKYAALQLNFLDFAISGVILAGLSLFMREPWTAPAFSSPWITNFLFILMFVSTGQLMIYGFNRLEAQIGSLIMLTEILFGTALAFMFLGETITPLTFLGGIIIIAAIAFPEVHALQTKRKHS
jgi:drug/metabolite transporter (DMT)-like permease